MSCRVELTCLLPLTGRCPPSPPPPQTITESLFSSNLAFGPDTRGGAVSLESVNSTVVMASTFFNNTCSLSASSCAQGGDASALGGAIYAQARARTSPPRLSLRRLLLCCRVQHDSLARSAGIRNPPRLSYWCFRNDSSPPQGDSAAVLSVSSTRFLNNSAVEGGAAAVEGLLSSSFAGVIATGNTASSAGGAMALIGPSPGLLANGTAAGAAAGPHPQPPSASCALPAGGVSALLGTLLANCSFADNASPGGDGGAVAAYAAHRLSACNATFARSSAGRGGTLFLNSSLEAPAAQPQLRKVTIAGSAASEGAGMFMQGATGASGAPQCAQCAVSGLASSNFGLQFASPPTMFAVEAPSVVRAGQPFAITVRLSDAFGNAVLSAPSAYGRAALAPAAAAAAGAAGANASASARASSAVLSGVGVAVYESGLAQFGGMSLFGAAGPQVVRVQMVVPTGMLLQPSMDVPITISPCQASLFFHRVHTPPLPFRFRDYALLLPPRSRCSPCTSLLRLTAGDRGV